MRRGLRYRDFPIALRIQLYFPRVLPLAELGRGKQVPRITIESELNSMSRKALENNMMTSLQRARNPMMRIGFWIGAIVLAALPLYFVRQMLALLIIFAAFFFVAAGIVLALYLIHQAGQFILVRTEPHILTMARASRRGLGSLGEFSKKQFRRQNPEVVP